ncbi:MAG: hypothetical protein PVI01_18065, partial [Gemmatimonadales bacterium]
MRRHHFITLAVFAAALLPGCVDQPAEPQSRGATSAPQMAALPDAGDFMPLASGNHWTYDRTFSTIVVPEDGPPPPPELIEEQVFLDHIEQRVIGERTYILEREVYSSESGANERLLRQDRAGYYTLERTKDDGKVAARPVLSGAQRNLVHRIAARYGADPASVQSHLTRIETVERMLRGLHAAPPGGPDPGEIQTLAYPLHPGATWMIRPAPFFSATVEGRERVAGLSSWRVRIDNEFLGENDTVHIWYSRCGQVGWRFHFESIATNPQGNVIGTFVSDDIVRLVDTR